MARTPRGTAGAQSPSRTRLEIPPDVLALLEASSRLGGMYKQWPAWHDDAIRAYWGKRSVRQIARALKRCRESVVMRAKQLGMEARQWNK